jgi:hypothetical protein
MLPEREKNPRKLECSIIYAANLFRMTRVSSSRQFIIAEIIPRLFRRFQQFWLFGLSGFLVMPAFRSFQMSCHSGHYPDVPVTEDKINLKRRSARNSLPIVAYCQINTIEYNNLYLFSIVVSKQYLCTYEFTTHDFAEPSGKGRTFDVFLTLLRSHCTQPLRFKSSISFISSFYILQLVSSIDNSTTVDLGEPHLRPVYQTSWLLVILRNMEETLMRRITVTASLN